MGKVRVSELIEHFDLKLVSGEKGIEREIVTSDISRPGLEMAGFFTYYPAERMQLLGKTELSFFGALSKEDRLERTAKLCSDETPCIVVSRGLDIPQELIDAAHASNVPLLSSSLKTTRLSGLVTNYLETRLAPMTSVHGVLVDVYGVGVLLTGDSGVGKSETALELVKRGHRLVADDSVEIRQAGENELVGNAPELIQHLLEIRGLGIINVMTLFGAGAVRNYKKVSLIIHLEFWNPEKMYDRLGLEEDHTQMVDTPLPRLTLPVRPGRNLAVIVEVASMNFRLKKMGVHAAKQFSDRLNDALKENK
ncbi:Hpr(Ser) kinase/phosphatase [Scopulibacillus darangshiensis]|uniref:HPr kinase/phosphorylase n=1 Tax=Scopulibacillus darangshiensis TaxID=442528 RepID=A0A4R2NSR5_9BACL|nr:HPr(Ser) kinase/phosphatase [Scopulibacillus darangshiensis]TCP24887.1 Hpr(Ser) kinase/phosphatase [Scopulibacillus darangshiensis]